MRQRTETKGLLSNDGTVDADPDVLAIAAELAELRPAVAAAGAARNELAPDGPGGHVRYPWRLGAAQERLDETTEQEDEAERRLSAARDAARSRIAESWRPRREAARRHLLEALAPVAEAEREMREVDAAAAAALGVAPPANPIPGLLAVHEQAGRLERELEGPRPAPGPPQVPDGKVRVRGLVGIWDHSVPHFYPRGSTLDVFSSEASRLVALDPPAVELVVA